MEISVKQKRGRQDKRAVSEVLATILIVLFVIAALVIVSVVLFQFIRSKSQEITAGCVSIDIAITKAEYNQTGNITIVYAKRAGGDAEMAGMKFVFDGREKTPSSESDNTALKILETGRYIFNNITSKPRKIEAAPIVKTDAEKEMNCGIKATIAEKDIVEKSISVSENIEPSPGEPQPPSQPSIAGLVGYWKFDEGTGTTASDSSGNNNHGILLNGPAWTTGKKGNALSFDGSNDYVTISSSNIFNFGVNPFAISIWLKGSTKTQYMNVMSYIDETARDPYYLVWFDNANGQIGISLSNNEANVIESVSNVLDGNWHNVIITRGFSDDFKIYVDGSLDNSNNYSGPIISNTATQFRIGKQMNSYPRNFNGIIDEVTIYNRVLSPEEASQLYQSV